MKNNENIITANCLFCIFNPGIMLIFFNFFQAKKEIDLKYVCFIIQ